MKFKTEFMPAYLFFAVFHYSEHIANSVQQLAELRGQKHAKNNDTDKSNVVND